MDEARGLIRPPPPVSTVYDNRDGTYGKLHFTSTPTGEGGRRNEIRLGKLMVGTHRMGKMDQKQSVGVNGLFEIELLSNSIADQFIEQIKTVRSFESLNENRRNRKRWKKYKEMDLIKLALVVPPPPPVWPIYSENGASITSIKR